MLNRCVWCCELGSGELHPWPDNPWGVKCLCEGCAAIPRLAFWRDWWIRTLHYLSTGRFMTPKGESWGRGRSN